MRPPHVYATVAADAHPDLLAALHGRWRVATRLVMILLSARGWSPAAIAELLGSHPRTVRRWIHRYTRQGEIGLADRPRPGRPRLGSPKLGERIRRLLDQPRAWTIGRLWRRLGRPAMSRRTLHRRVRGSPPGGDPGWSPRATPTPRPSWPGCARRSASSPPARWCSPEDETHSNLLPWVRATWVAHGARQRVMTPGTNRRRTSFGALDLASGRWCYRVARKAVSATFIAFLEQVAAAYANAPVLAMVCDNDVIHHSKIVRRWLADHPRVRLLHGARYSPHHNPVERIWAALQRALANSPTLTMAGRLRQVHAFFRQRAPAQLLATAAPSSSPWLPEGYGHNFREAA